ncbi:MAG: alanine--tRNA ligase [Myxococcota bacterium]
MDGAEIRRVFLRYFEERGHRVVRSGSLVPEADPTLMFVNAGMVPFKRVFVGEETRDYPRAVTSQKCMRVSGKHNDLEEVGVSPSHQTFFEMLGNFSFGDYFKKGAIEYGWDFLTNVVKVEPERLVVSIHEEDDEAYDVWRNEIGLASDRIFRLPDSENFWQMADTGPCGPCSEIHMITDQSAFDSGSDPSGDGYIELWNLVFMQFEQRPDGSRVPLPKPSIDTGLGLERLACVLQGVDSNYDTDLFRPLLARAGELAGVPYGSDPHSDMSMRVVADHARACAFLLGDGVLPANEGRGYVLRRVLRRAARHGVLLGIEEPFLYEVSDVVIGRMGAAYPELRERRDFILETIKREEERFGRTLGRGLQLLDEEVRRARRERRSQLAGDVVFKLYDTFGFPTDLTETILHGQGLDYDRAAFDARMQEQAERARAAWKGAGEGAPAEVYDRLAVRARSRFVGYEMLETRSRVLALLRDGDETEEVSEAERVEVVVETTPFYAESGGQVGDAGTLEGPDGRIEVEDAQQPVEGLIVHSGRVTLGRVRVGDEVGLSVDAARRAATVRNHSGTHLLQWALRSVLGPQVVQAGSLVAPERLRFDFTHDDPLTDEQIAEVEDLVNDLVLQNLPSQIEEKSREAAIESGAIAMFGEKYGEVVRVVSFGPSTELCGGTHTRATGDIGSFRIVSQTAIGAGVRRVEAQTGKGVLEQSRRDAATLRAASQLLKSPPSEVPERIEKLLERQKQLERELEQTRARLRRGGVGDPMQQLRELAGVRLITSEVEEASPKELRGMIDELKQRLGSGVVVLGTRHEGKAALAVGVTRDLSDRLAADALVKQIAPVVGGSGGGRPDFAQAGGSQPDKVPEALQRAAEVVAESLGE